MKKMSNYPILKLRQVTTLYSTRKEVDLTPLLLEDQNRHEHPVES